MTLRDALFLRMAELLALVPVAWDAEQRTIMLDGWDEIVADVSTEVATIRRESQA